MAGTVTPSKYSAMKGRGITHFVHRGVPEPLPWPDHQRRSINKSASAPRMHPHSIEERPVYASCRALPSALKQSGSFERFHYSISPYEALQEHNWRHAQKELAKIRAGQFKPGGKGLDAKRQSLKLRGHELRAELFRVLRHDWPTFLKVRLTPIPHLSCSRPLFLDWRGGGGSIRHQQRGLCVPMMCPLAPLSPACPPLTSSILRPDSGRRARHAARMLLSTSGAAHHEAAWRLACLHEQNACELPSGQRVLAQP